MQPTIAQLKRALQIAEEIESLQAELNSLVGSSSTVKAAVSSDAPAKRRGRPPAEKSAKTDRVKEDAPAKKAGRRTMSPEARQRIIDAQKARWAKVKGESSDSSSAKASKKKKAGRKAKKSSKKTAAESQD